MLCKSVQRVSENERLTLYFVIMWFTCNFLVYAILIKSCSVLLKHLEWFAFASYPLKQFSAKRFFVLFCFVLISLVLLHTAQSSKGQMKPMFESVFRLWVISLGPNFFHVVCLKILIWELWGIAQLSLVMEREASISSLPLWKFHSITRRITVYGWLNTVHHHF